MTRQPKHPPKLKTEKVAAPFVLLRTEQLPNLLPIGDDEIANILHILSDSSPVDFTIDNAIALCEEVIAQLGPERPETTVAVPRNHDLKSAREADAYDDYFPVVRVEGDARHVFALSLVSAFRDLLVEAKAGCSLTPLEWSLIRQGFVELVLLITGYEESYYKE